MSMREGSTVNVRELAHALLKEIEWRGTHASGYAYQNAEGHLGYYKAAVPGSQLSLKTLPRSANTARNVILHTRLATQGSVQNNDNNHPVINPSKNVALVHNGVIWNDASLRYQYLAGEVDDLADVDTAVIGAMLEAYGFEGWKHLAGDAAVGWLTHERMGLGVARIEGSPVSYTSLVDGSFVFASTSQLLENALQAVGLEYGAVFSMSEADAYDVQNGVIMAAVDIPRDRSYGIATPTWRAATGGGHGSEHGIGSSFMNRYNDSTGEWSYDPDDISSTAEDMDEREELIAMAMIEKLKNDGMESLPTKPEDDYYTIDHDGDYKTYMTIEDLETELKWVADLHDGDDHFGAEGNARWVERFVDIGTIDAKTGGLISFVDQPDELNWVESFENSDLEYIRDGITYLQR